MHVFLIGALAIGLGWLIFGRFTRIPAQGADAPASPADRALEGAADVAAARADAAQDLRDATGTTQPPTGWSPGSGGDAGGAP